MPITGDAKGGAARTKSKRGKPSDIIIPTLNQVERTLRKEFGRQFAEGAKAWAGRCYEVASACVNAGVVEGIAVYGHYLGPISRGSHFERAIGMPFVQHGWVILPDGRIFDPTRFAFEAKDPYLFVGENSGEYDEGGNVWRRANRQPPPAWSDSDRTVNLVEHIPIREQPSVLRFLQDLLGNMPKPGVLSMSQVFYVANMPYGDLGPHVRTIYRALSAAGQEATIPIDNFRRSERER